MSEPIWLLRPAVLFFHEESLRQFGGASGIRDVGMLESALDRPLNKYHYEQADVPRLAAAYAFGLALNHPFVDGNKRTALISMVTFLKLNGWQFTATEPDAYQAIWRLAAGELSEDELTAWVEANISLLAGA